MARKKLAVAIALALALAVSATGCGGGDGAPEGQRPTGEEPQRGGTFRVQSDAFEWTGNFDPTGEYLTMSWSLYSNMLIRTLLGYKHIEGPEGNELVPDLAEDMPEVSEDGRTYTFRLKDGIKFGPPVSREITSQDIAYAFERIGTEALVAQYGFYYDLIEGMNEFKQAGGLTERGNRISGIETPDDKTIVFRLTEATGDFPFRVAMPATGPIPREVARCFTKAGEYGRFVISSGPYMIEGSDDLDTSSCRTMRPLKGFNPNRHLTLVRNPDYDPETDTPEARSNYVDRFEMTLNTNPKDIFDRTKAGQLELADAPAPPEVIREYTTNDELEGRMQVDDADAIWFITMNLTQPPFDDVHVRRAVNLVMDKEGLRRAKGGATTGEIAHHILPNTMLADRLADYRPYGTEGDAGDEERAKEEMRQSKYDTNDDGICDAPECRNVLHVNRSTEEWQRLEPIVEESLRKIGIELVSRQYEDAYTIISNVRRNVPISTVPGWGKDYADPSTFMVVFDSRSIIPEGNINYSLVGITPELAEEIGVRGSVEDVPSVDADIDRCNGIADGEERLDCWADLDRKLMEEVVPWVPYIEIANVGIIGPAVTQYVYDQSTGEVAWSHVAVDPEKQQ